MTQKIEQLWYTSSPVGLRGSPGWQVRAASPALHDDPPRLRRLGAYLRYELLGGMRSAAVRPEDAPLTLGWYDTGHERILVQRSFVGKTWDQRPGNFFSHLLCDLPTSFTARDAIRYWRAPFWKNTDTLDLNTTKLQTFDLQLETTDLSLLDTLREENLAEELKRLLAIFLMRRPDQRFVIAAPPDTVAALIWGLTQTLPKGLFADLTFSTFESTIMSATAPLITGTLPCGEQTFPLSYIIQDQPSTAPFCPPQIDHYVKFAVFNLFDHPARLNDLITHAERSAERSKVSDFDTLYRRYMGAPISIR